MSDKNLGSSVTYLDPEGKSFDSVVFRADKPLSHSELGLIQDLQGEARAEAVRRLLPSGFVTGDFMEDNGSDFEFGTTANTFELVNKPIVNVNGWVLPLEYTSTISQDRNVIELDAPSVSTSDYDVSFVYLEVWRSLVEANPSDTNKPAIDKIYPHGNVLAPSDTWLDDDLKDAPVASNNGIETTRRVQIQYAIRATTLDDNRKRLGYDDIVSVIAQGPNSSKQAGATFTQSGGDPGLWIAGGILGSGNEIAGTIDGFVYSIPIAMVYRRNAAGFDFQNNNGGILGVGTATPSDRPDGLYADQVVYDDLQDLRVLCTNSPDWSQLLEKNTALLLDNNLKSWAMDSGTDADWQVGGKTSVGTRVLVADDLSASVTTAGNEFRKPDGICTVFSDRAHHELHVVEFDIEIMGLGPVWDEDESIILSLGDGIESNAVYLDVLDEVPEGTSISDVFSVRLNDGDVGSTTGFPEISIKKVEFTDNNTQVEITLGQTPFPSGENLWVELEIAYPAGGGTTSLVDSKPDNYSFVAHDPSTFSEIGAFANTDADREAIRQYIDVTYEEGPHREVEVMYHASDPLPPFTTYVHDGVEVTLPEFPYVSDPLNPGPDITVTVGSVTQTISSVEGRVITIDTSFPDGTEASVVYTPHRPIEKGKDLTLYYMTPAMQAIPYPYLYEGTVSSPLELEVLYAPEYLYSVTASSGSHITPFPYEAPSNQIPVREDIGDGRYTGEEELSAPGPISIDDFDADVGLLKLPTFVPMVPVSTLTLTDPISVVGMGTHTHVVDHFTSVDTNEYQPSAIAQSLSTAVEHKTFMPVLARLKQDTDFARKGSVVLVIMTQYFDSANDQVSSEENRVAMGNPLACAAIYKVKGNVLTHE